MRGYAAAVLCALLACSPPEDEPATTPPSAPEREIDLSAFFAGVDSGDATFVMLKSGSGELVRYNAERARRRFIPASTFKIPNALIALETGVADGPDHLIRWDGVKPNDGGFWSPAWSQDHTLRTAMRSSVYWYFQQIARDVGADRMQHYLDQFDYGNRSMGGGLDRFWLHGDLRISPDEQVRFLQRMHAGDLGVSERSTRILKDVLVLDSTTTYRLSGKTGTAQLTPERDLLWLVGYIERAADTWFLALNVEGEEVWARWGSPAARVRLVHQLLAAIEGE